MRDQRLLDIDTFHRPPSARFRPHLILVTAVLTGVISAAICACAILAPAPPAAVPLVIAMCVGGPIFSSWEVPRALAALRARRGGDALAKLRQTLDALPEVDHPLGL